MAKSKMGKPLHDSKVYDFIGIEDNVDPLSNRRSVVRCTNLEPHVEPGIFTLREPYQLKYKKPTDLIYQRSNTEEFISFDNFYEKTARDQAEVTVLVSKAEIQAPIIGGSRITGYKFNSVNIYIRPYWTGSYWNDSWLWLNEPFITKITVEPDATYKNKIQVSGYFGNMLQWTLINVTKDKTLPYAILRSAQNGSNTDLWLSVFDPDFDVNDEIVLMRNYIPIKYLIQNYNVLREEIHFHRILSKMRIGFGGKEGRMALGIDYAHRTLQLDDYNFEATDPLIADNELYFANCNRVIIQPYALFNEANLDFDIDIKVSTGTYAAGTYYFRMTGVLNATDEIMVVEKSITVNDVSKFTVAAFIRAGSLSRRLTAVKFYFSDNGNDYYFVREIEVTTDQESITAPSWILLDNGYLTTEVIATGSPLADTNVYNMDNCATSPADSSVDYWWTPIGSPSGATITKTIVAGSSNAMELEIAVYPDRSGVTFVTNNLSPKLKAGTNYILEINAKASIRSQVTFKLWYYNQYSERVVETLASFVVNTIYETQEISIWIPDDFLPGQTYGYDILEITFTRSVGVATIGDSITIESILISEAPSGETDAGSVLGAEMSAELGYQPTFNLVRDWMNAVYLNGITYVSPAFIEKRYETFVFGSQINGDGANMHDVIPAGSTVFPVDEYRGEIVTGMVVMHNLNIAVFTDGGLIILDPDTGNTREVARGFGLKVKGSIMVFRGHIIYASDDDFIKISAASGYNAEIISSRSVRKIYNALTDKLKLSACFDRFGTYHVSLGEEAEYRELLLTDRGWINQDRQHYPQVFRNGLGGRVWFLNEGDIYAMPYSEEEFIGYADLYGDYRAGW